MTFEETLEDSVKRFLNTVVVVDDKAQLILESKESTTPRTAKKREFGEVRASNIENTARPADAAEDAEDNFESHDLDAKSLTDSFATQGLACCVLRPRNSTEAMKCTLSTARRADILVIDWKLADKGTVAPNIISQVLKEDSEAGGRLRLVVVYTGETSLEGPRNSLEKKIKGALRADAKIERALVNDDSPNEYVLLGDHFRVVFLIKSHVRMGPEHLKVSEADLPEKLVNEFSKLASGFLSNIALTSISALRDGTHKLLARFNESLDGAYMAHRTLSPFPENAGNYAVRLTASAIDDLIQMRVIDSQCSNEEAVILWLQQKINGGAKFSVQKNTGAHELNSDDMKCLLTRGAEKFYEKNSIQDLNLKKFKNSQVRIFYPDDASSENAFLEFSRMSSLRAEAYGTGWPDKKLRPTLQLGSIVKKDTSYFLCIQPLCDGVRIKNDELRSFIFAPLHEVSDKNPNFVVKSSKGEDIRLLIEKRAYNLKTWKFRAFSSIDGKVFAHISREGDRYFQNAAKAKFIWLGELKRDFALKMAQDFIGHLGRLGFDEYEAQSDKFANR